ncbi:DMT family transporter [Helicobacter sp. T3_23-1056]
MSENFTKHNVAKRHFFKHNHNFFKNALGHFLAIFTIVVWGSTFSSTKALLSDFAPAEILFIRFFLAYIFLALLCRKVIAFRGVKNELLFAGAGLSGSCLYFLLENIALNYTSASNASLLVAFNPITTALLSWILFGERLGRFYTLGFGLCFVGIVLVVLNGKNSVEISPFGDFLCILAGLTWSVYTIILERLFGVYREENAIAMTRKIFFYGIIFTLPFALWQSVELSGGDFSKVIESSRFSNPANALNLLFLGLVASALCYLSWNACLKRLGTLQASAYIYAIPVVGVFIATLTLGESLTPYLIFGGILTLLGLFVSQK